MQSATLVNGTPFIGLRSSEYLALRRFFLKETGIDLDLYDGNAPAIAIHQIMDQHKVLFLEDLLKAAQSDSMLRFHILQALTINQTEFFRNHNEQDSWCNLLERRVLPALSHLAEGVSVWSAGCSRGCELYTAAMIVEDMHPGLPHRFVGTDIDEMSLHSAKYGAYPDGISPKRDWCMACLPDHYFKRYFVGWDPIYRIVPELRRKTGFYKRNLLGNQPLRGLPQEYDVVICRYVAMYFNADGKQRLYRNLSMAVRPGGFLLSDFGADLSDYGLLAEVATIGSFLYRKAYP